MKNETDAAEMDTHDPRSYDLLTLQSMLRIETMMRDMLPLMETLSDTLDQVLKLPMVRMWMGRGR